MKRPLSAILALALGLGSVPAQAQTALARPSIQTGASAPTPIAGGFAPALRAFTPSLAAPALSLTPATAPYAPLAAPVSPLVTAAAVPVLPASSLPASPALSPSRVEAPLEALRAISGPESAARAGESFDGALTRSAASAVEPGAAPESAATPNKPGRLARYREHRKQPPSALSILGKGLVLGALTAAAAPVLSGAAPAAKLIYALAAVSALLLSVLIPAGIAVWAARKLGRAPQTAAKPPPSFRVKLAMLALGGILGLGLGGVPYYATGPIVERVAASTDRRTAPEEQAHARWISGGAVESETIMVLSQNPVGLATLDALRDRFGVLHLPTFFVSRQPDSYAQHENSFDGVYLSEAEITGRGWTVEQFLKDPALQRRLIREISSTVVHELTHAVQGRRPPWTPGYFKNTIEAEQEAFFQEMLFRLAALEADPNARNNGVDRWMIPDAAESIDVFLSIVAESYPKNVVIGRDPYFNAYIAAQRARWPAYRVHIYQVLAAHAETPGSAKMYLDKAKAAAKAAGLPEPARLVASR
jgi:hypothetical protein